jgi:phospholipid-binding lipoprotein MlaA
LINRPITTGLSGLALAAFVASCGPAAMPPGDSIVDADEAQNRAVHDFNVSVDRALFGPASREFGSAVPEPLREGFDNFASNLSQPSYVLNNILQLRLGQASQNTLRFMVNTTIGLGGIFDPATALGLVEQETDFGETLYIYGLPEGDFVMLPFLGPSTTRDTLGLVLDIATDPLRYVLPTTESRYVFVVEAADELSDRAAFADTIDSVLYESADSYTQVRSIYLQNRRFELSEGAAGVETGGAGDDIYADPYTSPSSDPYMDPYTDPYAP